MLLSRIFKKKKTPIKKKNSNEIEILDEIDELELLDMIDED